MPKWIEVFLHGENILIEDLEAYRESMPLEYELLKVQNVSTLIAFPISVHEKLIGFVGVDNPDMEKSSLIHRLLSLLGKYVGTMIKDHKLFEKNIAPKPMVIMGKPQYKDDDEFIYTIQRVNREDAEYINMLMLDRVDRHMGYADWSRIKSSVIRYIEFHKKINMKAPINYEPLINKIKES